MSKLGTPNKNFIKPKTKPAMAPALYGHSSNPTINSARVHRLGINSRVTFESGYANEDEAGQAQPARGNDPEEHIQIQDFLETLRE